MILGSTQVEVTLTSIVSPISVSSRLHASGGNSIGKAPTSRTFALGSTQVEVVERHIKYTKKIKLNAKRNIVKFNSIQII